MSLGLQKFFGWVYKNMGLGNNQCMRVASKMFIFLGCLGLLCVLVARQNALLDLGIDGSLTAYYVGGGQSVTPYGQVGSVDKRAYALRIDTTGGAQTAERVKKRLKITHEQREQVGEICVQYGYSFLLEKVEYGKAQKYNVMIAVVGDKVVVGYPIIVGSF